MSERGVGEDEVGWGGKDQIIQGLLDHGKGFRLCIELDGKPLENFE